MQQPTGQTQQRALHEYQLVELAERIQNNPQGWYAVALHLSRLSPVNRRESHLRVALRLIDGFVQAYRHHVFHLVNDDVVVAVQGMRLADLDALIYRLRALFANDPLTYEDAGDGRDPFCTWYDLVAAPEGFVDMARRAQAEAQRTGGRRTRAQALPTIDPATLERAVGVLQETRVLDMVRRQPVIHVPEGGSVASGIFQEFYFAIAEVQKAVAPDVAVTGDRWLFQHLSRELDRRMLAEVAGLELAHWPPELSLNLNLANVDTQPFERAVERLRRAGTRLAVEFQVMDIFADLDLWFRMRDSLQAAGHRVVLDGLNAMSLGFVDVGLLAPDRVKMTWSPELARVMGSRESELRQGLEAVGLERVVLARCDSEAAIRWGQQEGLGLFQGQYVDAMMAAVTKAQCGRDCACSFKDVIRRRGVVSPDRRRKCNNPDLHDSIPDITLPGR